MKRIFILTLFLFLPASVALIVAQTLTGRVVDASSGEPIDIATVFYEGRNISAGTNSKGEFTLPYHGGRISVTAMGYFQVLLPVPQPNKPMLIKMEPNGALTLQESVVNVKRKKYSRKDNPAVLLMQKVIAAKRLSDLSKNDYYSFREYQKITFAANDLTADSLNNSRMKSLNFMKEHIEVNPETGKRILPISVSETVSKHIYRQKPKSEKTIIEAQRSNGINDFFNTGDILNVLLKDVFTNINIYDNDVRLFQAQFVSPLSTQSAIGFYRFFINDTTTIGTDSVISVTFLPNNQQDFGFAGKLYILHDGTYRVRRAEFGIPRRSDVNFVEDLTVKQEFISLPSGEQVLSADEMVVQLKIADFLQKFQVQRTTHYSDYAFEEIPDKQFKFTGNTFTEPSALMRTHEYWEQHRPVPLTKSEDQMDLLVKRLSNVKGFKPVLFVTKAFIENFIETSTDPKVPNLVDIGPVNTMITSNYVDGLRLRLSGHTTANLNPHLFAKGYIAYGFKDQRWKGLGELTYSFVKKTYLPREYPVHNLTLGYQNDVMSPSDIFMPTDKDNVFTSFKWNTVDHMQYFRKLYLNYDREWSNGLRVMIKAKREEIEPTGTLIYQRLNSTLTPSVLPTDRVKSITNTELTAGVIYQPGVLYINTKQRRITANDDAPRLSLFHSFGLKGVLGGQYNYNFTEAAIYKRFKLSSWGRIDTHLKGGVQWNQVPYPLLIMPPANLSFIIEDGTFSLIDNMEFLNDRYASLQASWDLNGKLFNRVPLLKHLKWREFIGFNMLWGTLTDKNNPFLAENAGNSQLFFFPGHFDEAGQYIYSSGVMNKKTPYMEAIVGIHNIFKIFHIQYVRRLNYLDNPNTKRWGVRFMFRIQF